MVNKSLAKEAGMSTRNFNRRFKAATGSIVVTSIQLVRVEKAKKELEGGRKSLMKSLLMLGTKM
mgnify:CR=1 FL=1